MTKLEIARREIDVAVKLLFDGGDPIAVMVLAAAARGIVSALCEIAGKPGLIEYLQEDHPALARNDIFKRANRRANWFKHAGDNDAEGVMDDFDPAEADVILFWAAHDLGVLTNPQSVETGVFVGWFLARVAPGTYEIADSAFPGLSALPRDHALLTGRAALITAFTIPFERKPLDMIFRRPTPS